MEKSELIICLETLQKGDLKGDLIFIEKYCGMGVVKSLLEHCEGTELRIVPFSQLREPIKRRIRDIMAQEPAITHNQLRNRLRVPLYTIKQLLDEIASESKQATIMTIDNSEYKKVS